MRRTLLLLPALLIVVLARPVRAADDYVPGPDSKRQPGVPEGRITKFTFDRSKIFPGTTREVSVYVPQQYDGSKPACVLVCQDGVQYQAPVVFDNLIHRKEMPVTVGVFITPGVLKALSTNQQDRFNRSYEYDGLGDQYARFVLDEVLPEVAGRLQLNLSTNGNDRAIAGASSGAICAFTAAWERPDAFQRVFSSIGTYVGLRGGNDYPTLIRKTEPKPIRIFLQDGSGDLNIYGGDWWMANQEMQRALVFAGYEVRHAWGDGGHNGKHATAVFPDAMRWLWQDWPKPVAAGRGSPFLRELLIPGEGWQVVSEGHTFTEGPAANRQGEVFFTDVPGNRIHRVGLDGKVSVFADDTGGANGLMFGPDDRLYACAGARKQVVAYDAAGRASVLAEGIAGNDLCVRQNGDLYVTEPDARQIWLVTPGGAKRVVDKAGGLEFPNGVLLSADQGLLFVADSRGQFVWSYQVQPDGSLRHKQRYFHLHLPDAAHSGADGMTTSTKGHLYITTAAGLQISDQPGRVNAILPRPQNRWLSNVCFGGPNLDTLYITCGDKLYRRKVNAQGVTAANPVKPPKPGL
ncbi:MAG: Gluconolactonase precursor [Verrucomicrobiota bacterium]